MRVCIDAGVDTASSLVRLFHLQGVELDGPASVLLPAAVPAYAVRVLTGAEAVEAARLLPGDGRGTGVGAGSPFTARVLDARELHGAGSDRSCLHVELDITGSQVWCCTARLATSAGLRAEQPCLGRGRSFSRLARLMRSACCVRPELRRGVRDEIGMKHLWRGDMMMYALCWDTNIASPEHGHSAQGMLLPSMLPDGRIFC